MYKIYNITILLHHNHNKTQSHSPPPPPPPTLTDETPECYNSTTNFNWCYTDVLPAPGNAYNIYIADIIFMIIIML